MKTGNDQNEQPDPVTEAVFAGENVEEFSLKDVAAAFAFRLADFSPLPKDLFLCDGPRDGRHNKRKNDDPKYLPRDRHLK